MAHKYLISGGATLTDPVHHRNAGDRLESALVRVAEAVSRLQQQRAAAQARYEMLDRAGSEILVMIDALMTGSDQQRQGSEATGSLQLSPARPASTETADAA